MAKATMAAAAAAAAGKSDSDRRVARIKALLDTLAELHTKTEAILAELRKIAAGEAATGDHLRRLERCFSGEWERRYGHAYVFSFAKDRALWKRLLQAAPVDVIEARILTYLHDDDAFIARERHPFGLFVARFNSLAAYQPPVEDLALDSPAIGCSHRPPCRSDQEHTRRKLADMRGAGLEATH